jgi:L-asparaginase
MRTLAQFIVFFLVFTAEASMPKVMILTTGGTIAGQSNTGSATGYSAGQLGAQALIAGIPGIEKVAELSTEKISAVGSQDISDDILLKLAERIKKISEEKIFDGVVITHGTDTLEETAFFLDLVLPQNFPVVIVGAMRPADALSADGPANLYQAIQVASAPQARARGVLSVANSAIYAARHVQKTHTSAPDAFRAPNTGPLGYVDKSGVRFLINTPPGSTDTARFKLPQQLPRVDILYVYGQVDDFAIEPSLARGARGLIIAGFGGGNAPKALIEALSKVAARDIPVVRASRVGAGLVERNIENDDDKLGFIAAQDLSPQKSRILLRVLLANGVQNSKEIQAAFTVSN